MDEDKFDEMYGAVIEDVFNTIQSMSSRIADVIEPSPDRLKAAHGLITTLISKGQQAKQANPGEWDERLEFEMNSLIHLYLPLLEMIMRIQRDIIRIEPTLREYLATPQNLTGGQ